MGKGIALQFKKAFPAYFKSYEQACRRKEVVLGKMFVFDNGQLARPCWIVNFPTKGHWRSRSRISDLEAGLDDLRAVIVELKVTSIALPPLGCGNGGAELGRRATADRGQAPGPRDRGAHLRPRRRSGCCRHEGCHSAASLTAGKGAALAAFNRDQNAGIEDHRP